MKNEDRTKEELIEMLKKSEQEENYYKESMQFLQEETRVLKKELRQYKHRSKMKKYREETKDLHTCYYEDENGERHLDYGRDDCPICLQEHRMERYGADIHDVRCVCNECNNIGYGRSDY
jgi:DNA repair exonuclease SbcCD ATPase subunit